MDIASIRKEYAQKSLDEKDVFANPLKQFQSWFSEAIEAEVPEPNAMHLATTDAHGKPHGRIVLLKGLENGGFVFFTNYQSHKGMQLAANGYASLTFFWAELERQVRIEGKVTKVSAQESDQYFLSRPAGSRIGAWVSPQSQKIPNRAYLEKRLEELMAEFEGKEVNRPPHWGGFTLQAEAIEFWQGRPSRLHDRILYEINADGTWEINRLAP